MSDPDRNGSGLALVIDGDAGTRRVVAPLLAARGLRAVHAHTAIAGLEMLRQLPDAFRVVLVSIELAGLSGLVVIETLRHFRPDLPVVCLTAAEAVGAAPCVSKPVRESEVAAHLDEALAGRRAPHHPVSFGPNVLARAKARYDSTGDLVEAALELARDVGDQAGW